MSRFAFVLLHSLHLHEENTKYEFDYFFHSFNFDSNYFDMVSSVFLRQPISQSQVLNLIEISLIQFLFCSFCLKFVSISMRLIPYSVEVFPQIHFLFPHIREFRMTLEDVTGGKYWIFLLDFLNSPPFSSTSCIHGC
jgi:hypothetical protein